MVVLILISRSLMNAGYQRYSIPQTVMCVDPPTAASKRYNISLPGRTMRDDSAKEGVRKMYSVLSSPTKMLLWGFQKSCKTIINLCTGLKSRPQRSGKGLPPTRCARAPWSPGKAASGSSEDSSAPKPWYPAATQLSSDLCYSAL